MSALLGLLFGLFQGFRHAFEPDHVVAVSTMISERKDARTRVAYAAAWGMGHATMLALVGGLLMALRTELPARLDAAFELAVSLMLVALGLRAVFAAWRDWRRSGEAPEQAGGHASFRSWRSIGPLAMGMVHGLAGSGALTAFVVARLPSVSDGVTFMLVFGAGATIGMSILAGVAGIPIGRILATRWGMPALLGSTGSLSFLLGASWLFPALVRLSARTV